MGILSRAANLEVIDIIECDEVEEIFEDEGRSSLALAKLKTLRLHGLPRLRKVGILSRAPNLGVIHISNCEEIEEIFKDEDRYFLTLPKLKEVWLYDLPRLRMVGISLSDFPDLISISCSNICSPETNCAKCGGLEDVFKMK